MEILKGIEIIDLCLYLKESKTLIIPDLHIGYEEALNKQGIYVPRFQFKDTTERLKSILDLIQPLVSIPNVRATRENPKIYNNLNKIILIGDVKHEFGTISETEWKQTLAVLDLLEKYTKEIILIKGNHDTILGPIARKKDLKILPYLMLNNILLAHGDKLIENEETKSAKTIIIGHEHPAITLREKAKRETFKCFLVGNYKSKLLKLSKQKLIVMPSFNLVTTGTDILKERLLSPYLANIDNFEVIVVENQELFNFGKIKNLKK